jgi:hypothetical protein
LPTFSPTINAVPVVLPPEMTIVVGTFNFLGSAPSVTTKPPAGAAGDTVTVKVAGACASLMLFVFTDMVIVPGGRTVTKEVLSGKPGALALMVVVPVENGVTLKLTTWVPNENGTELGAVATAGLLEVRTKEKLLCAGPVSAKVNVPSLVIPRIVRFAGVSEAPRPTVTAVVAGFKPTAVAVMVVVPCNKPFKFDCRVGTVSPALIETPPSEVTAFVGSLLVN